MKKHNSLLLALLAMLLWGSLFPMVKLGYVAFSVQGVGDILLFAGIRFTVCGAVICLFALAFDRGSFGAVPGSILPIILSGLLAVALHYGFTYTALTVTDSSRTAIMKQIGGLIYVCFSFLFFREDKLTLSKLLGALLGFAGIVAINWEQGSPGFDLGTLLVICASLCTVASNIISKKVLAEVTPVTMTGVSQLFGGVVLASVGLALGGSITPDPSQWYIFAYICAASVFSYCIWFSLVRHSRLSGLFIIKFAEPVFACIFSRILLGENVLSFRYLIALLLISLGIALAHAQKAKA